MDPLKTQLDNHSKQLNRETDEFWQARGYTKRPSDWQTRDEKLPPSPELAAPKKS